MNGEFVGEIRSDDEVSVGTSGNFDGRIFAQRVVVEEGGRISGEIDAHDVVVRSGGSIAGVAVQAASLTLEAQSDADGAHFQVRQDFQRSHPETERSSKGAEPDPDRGDWGDSVDRANGSG